LQAENAQEIPSFMRSLTEFRAKRAEKLQQSLASCIVHASCPLPAKPYMLTYSPKTVAETVDNNDLLVLKTTV
jgi:hypothetical protein